MEISPEYSLDGLMLKLKPQDLVTLCKECTHWQRPWCWERLKAGGQFCLLVGSDDKESAFSVGDPGFISRSGSSPGEGMTTHSSILENPMNRVTLWATVHGAAKRQTRLSNSHSLTQVVLFPSLPNLYTFYCIAFSKAWTFLGQDLQWLKWSINCSVVSDSLGPHVLQNSMSVEFSRQEY